MISVKFGVEEKVAVGETRPSDTLKFALKLLYFAIAVCIGTWGAWELLLRIAYPID